jgi:hypoxanthine phosphoribosyltransferase
MKKRLRNKENGYYPALSHIARVSNSELSLRRICNSIAKSTAKALGAGGCRILFLDSGKRYLSTIGAFGLSDFYLRKGLLDAHKSLPEILEGKVVFVPDATNDERVQHKQIAEAQRVCSILGAPIEDKGEILGEIRVYTHEPHDFPEEARRFLVSVTNMSTMLLERHRLQQLLVNSHQQDEKGLISPPQPKLTASTLRPTEFAHPSEEEFANILDFYCVEWLYEPQSFPLNWDNDRVTEMFTPDFYLPELNIYVELTTLKQSLMTSKNRKLRKLKELYPNINIKLLTKNDIANLLASHGYNPAVETKTEGVAQILYSHSQLQRRVRTLAKRISNDYAGQQLVMVGILKGVICFISDLMQHISIPLTLDIMSISYYGGNGQVVKITKDLDGSIAGRHVLMVEDIIDTGMTLNYVLNYLRAHNPASLHVCALFDKRTRRLVDIPLDYIGFEVPDKFVVGYGLDYKGEYRNLPFVGVLRPELIRNGVPVTDIQDKNKRQE